MTTYRIDITITNKQTGKPYKGFASTQDGYDLQETARDIVEVLGDEILNDRGDQ